MRAYFMILTSLSLSTLSLAGTPDKDPIVKERRQRFIEARTPTLADLELGKTWRCIFYNSFPGSFDHTGPGPTFIFSEFDGLVTSEIHFSHSEHAFQLSEKHFSDFVTTKLPKDNYLPIYSMLYFRVSKSGDLVIESVFDDDIHFLNGSPRSISNSTKIVAQYGVCPKNKL
jgi:hypothetical protein